MVLLLAVCFSRAALIKLLYIYILLREPMNAIIMKSGIKIQRIMLHTKIKLEVEIF